MADNSKRNSSGWHWSCASKYCRNSWRTQNAKYYTLTKVATEKKMVQDAYLSVIGRPKEEINFKKQVICSKHWESGQRRDLQDLPTIKFTENGTQKPSTSKQEHWNCAAVLCTNSWRTQGKDNLKYYRLKDIASCPKKRIAYNKVLKSKGTDFDKDFICSAHWSKGERQNIDDLPNLACEPAFTDKKVTKKITPAKKIASAKRCINQQHLEGSKPKRRALSYITRRTESSEVDILQKQINDLKEKLEEKTTEVNQLHDKVKGFEADNKTCQLQLKQFIHKTEKSTFSYKCLKKTPSQFYYMSGLTVEDFDCLYECVEPYVDAIIYPDCKSNQQRKLTKRTELLCFMTVCRHTLNLGIIGYMTNTSQPTQSRIFAAWAVFLSTLFDHLDLSPCPGEVPSLLPKDFFSSGFHDTVLLGDCTENWIASPENYDVSSVTFSSYKNHDTGKTGIWITPYGGLVMCTDTYPGAITDNDLTEDCGVLDMIKEKGATVLSDKGFGIEDLCHSKGLSHNRPPMKFDTQYEESDIAKNFDVATLRIYNENFIGRMRDWSILNACWPKNRCDLLGHVYNVFANIVNLLFNPICARDGAKAKDKLPDENTTDATPPLSFFI